MRLTSDITRREWHEMLLADYHLRRTAARKRRALTPRGSKQRRYLSHLILDFGRWIALHKREMLKEQLR